VEEQHWPLVAHPFDHITDSDLDLSDLRDLCGNYLINSLKFNLPKSEDLTVRDVEHLESRKAPGYTWEYDEYGDLGISDEELATIEIPSSSQPDAGSMTQTISSCPLANVDARQLTPLIWSKASDLQTHREPEDFASHHNGVFKHVGGLKTSSMDLLRESTKSHEESEKAVIPVPTPIIRPRFPESIRNRSVMLGICPDTSLRVCFRVGEAINVGTLALRNGIDVVIELYARVTHSSRPLTIDILIKDSSPTRSRSPILKTRFTKNRLSQEFVLHDLFHPRPPHLVGTFDLWYGSDVWDDDAKVFLTENGCLESQNLCRCVGRIKREIDEESKTYSLTFIILHIRQTVWSEIEAVKQLVSESVG
jgi:hypothetical protein